MVSGIRPSELTLDGQTLAALGATCVDHGTATLGLHADQETVGASALGLGGLVCTLHVRSLRKFSFLLACAPLMDVQYPILPRPSMPAKRTHHTVGARK